MADFLCETCGAIDFYSLIYHRNQLTQTKKAIAEKKVTLGILEDLIKRSRQCRLCDLIVGALRKRHEETVAANVVSSSPSLSISTDSRHIKPSYSKDNTKSEETVLSPNETAASFESLMSSNCMLEPVFFCSQDHNIDINRLLVTLNPDPSNSFRYAYTDCIKLNPSWDESRSVSMTIPHRSSELIEPEEQIAYPVSLAGSARPVKPLVDLELVQKWLSTCEENHGSECTSPQWLSSNSEEEWRGLFRVIDVKNKCIIDASPTCRFFTLSYVWGSSEIAIDGRSRMQMTKENLARLQEHNGLNELTLPRTIMDAMVLISSLGERYLWVDALCIVQDDVTEMVHQIAQMDLVYAGAIMTIIVGPGEDVDAGIPGVGNYTRDIFYNRVKVSPKGLCLTPAASLGSLDDLQFSRWNSRGWTFQERLLSRRVLIFCHKQVYWICERNVWDEETILELDTPSVWVLPQALGCYDEWDDGYPKFSRSSLSLYVTQYSQRQLTYPSDAMPAFNGLAKRYEYRNNEKLHWGLPTIRFDQSLLWKFGSDRRQKKCNIALDGGSTCTVQYPSWSWLGWDGFIGSNIANERLYEKTLRDESYSELDFSL
jgi:Heterokaryon incompatibility protein (HET)